MTLGVGRNALRHAQAVAPAVMSRQPAPAPAARVLAPSEQLRTQRSSNMAARLADPARQPAITCGPGLWPLWPGRQFRPLRAWRSDVFSPAPAPPMPRDRRGPLVRVAAVIV